MAKANLKILRKASAISLLLIMLFSIGYTYAATTIYPSNFTDPSYNSVTSDQWYIGAVNLTNFFTNYQNPNFTTVNASQYLIDGVDITTLWGGNVNGTAIDVTSVNSSQYLLDGIDISTLWGVNGTPIDVTSIDSDQYYIGGVNVTDWMIAHADPNSGAIANWSDAAFTYVISTNGSLVWATNTNTGSVDFTATGKELSVVLASVVHNITATDGGDIGGSVFIKRSTNPTDYAIPGRYTLSVDYDLSATVSISEGVSVYSDGAMLNITALDDMALYFYSTVGIYNVKSHNLVITGLGFVGATANTNTVAITLNGSGRLTEISQIMTSMVQNPMDITGASYRVEVRNCFLEGAGTGVYANIGIHAYDTGGAYPNGLTIISCDISGFDNGVKLEAGYGIKIVNLYQEANNCGVNITGTVISPTIVNSFIQTPAGATGQSCIWASKIFEISGTYLELNAGDYGIVSGADSVIMSASAIRIYCAGSGSAGIYAGIGNHLYGSLSGSTIQGSSGSTGMLGDIERMTVSGVFFTGGTIGVNSTGSATVYSGCKFYNMVTGMNLTGYDNMVEGCNFDTVSTNMLLLSGGRHLVHDCLFRGNGAALTVLSGTGYDVKNNYNYTTENYGALAVHNGDTADSIAHGLATTPTIVTLTANYDSSAYVTAMNATHIDIAYTNPAATKAIYWTAAYDVP